MSAGLLQVLLQLGYRLALGAWQALGDPSIYDCDIEASLISKDSAVNFALSWWG